MFNVLHLHGEKVHEGGSLREVRVLLADDYEPWRRCVSSLLLRQSEWKVIGEVSDGLEAVQKTQELKPDLILLDLSLPKLSGVEAANRIRRIAPATKIVSITAYRDSDAMQTVLRNEAEGYVLEWEVKKIFSPPLKPFSGEENSSAQNSPIPLRAGAHSRGVIEANSLRTKTHCSHCFRPGESYQPPTPESPPA